ENSLLLVRPPLAGMRKSTCTLPRFFSASWQPARAILQKSDELFVTNANFNFLPELPPAPPPPAPLVSSFLPQPGAPRKRASAVSTLAHRNQACVAQISNPCHVRRGEYRRFPIG